MKTLITAADIKAHTVASLSVEAHKLAIAITDAQQRHLRPLIGAKLLTQLLALVEDAPDLPSGTGAAQVVAAATTKYEQDLAAWRLAHAADPLLALLDQLTPCLAQWALVEAWPNLLVHVENAGVLLKTGNANGTTTADVATLNQVLSAHQATAVWRGDELVNWLERNKTDYPAYQSSCPLASNREPSEWFGGISI